MGKVHQNALLQLDQAHLDLDVTSFSLIGEEKVVAMV